MSSIRYFSTIMVSSNYLPQTKKSQSLLIIYTFGVAIRERGSVLGMAQEFWDFAKLAIA